MEKFETWPEVVRLQLRPYETNAVVEILKAHLEHCKKIKPDAVTLIRTLNNVIERIEQQKQ